MLIFYFWEISYTILCDIISSPLKYLILIMIFNEFLLEKEKFLPRKPHTPTNCISTLAKEEVGWDFDKISGVVYYSFWKKVDKELLM